MSAQPLVSIIIPCYNSARFVIKAVESALAQTYALTEVIVVDDGSTDDTKVRLAPLGDRIQYVYQPNGGLSRARNRGIKEARGDLIAFLDADDEWLPTKLQLQWECLQANPDAHLIYTDLFRLHEPDGKCTYEYRDRKRFSGASYQEFFWGNAVVPSTVIVTRQCLDRVGCFDETIRGASTQDLDLWIRISRHFPLCYVDKPLVLYRVHDSNGSKNRCMMLEDEYYVLAKALQEDLALSDSLGRDNVRRRMSALAFQAGYANAQAGNLSGARRYFGNALSYAPQGLRCWIYWASTFLPAGIWQRLRRLKQGLTLQNGKH